MTSFSARALVVDDEAISRKMVVFALQKEGFECDVAADGVEALRKLDSGDYELVVTDLRMPNKNGGELVIEMLGRHRPPLIVVHTSVLEPEVASGLIDEGVDDIVFKPVDYAAFAGKTRALLNRRRAEGRKRGTRFHSRSMQGSNHASIPAGMHGGFVSEPSQVSGLSDGEFEDLLSNAAAAQAKTPEQVGKYRLIRKLGEGGMGQVYEAQHVLLNRRCAAKLILPEYTSNRIALVRFEREVQTMASLSHWNTVRVFDYGSTESGQFYYVMELLDGITLEELVRKNGPLSSERAIHYLIQVCDSLNEAHRAGLVHRDLKPGNIMTACVGGIPDVAKVLDFGLVRGGDFGSNSSSILTVVNCLCGTPKYIAPEQVMEPSTVDGRADVYSLGATAYFLMTGQAPFQRASAVATAMAHVQDPVISPTIYNPLISPRLEQMILKCMSKSPQERYQDMTEVRDALAQLGV